MRCPFPIPVLTTFLVIFGFATTVLTLQGLDQTSKMVDFDSVYPKVQIPHFSEKNWIKTPILYMGVLDPPPISENVPYTRAFVLRNR